MQRARDSPGSPGVFVGLANQYRQAGRLAEAPGAYEKALASTSIVSRRFVVRNPLDAGQIEWLACSQSVRGWSLKTRGPTLSR
jgi:hypothetical protein